MPAMAAPLATTDLRSIRVLVTGATSGLGHVMAQALAQAGARSVVTSRDHDRAEEVARRVVAIGYRLASLWRVS